MSEQTLPTDHFSRRLRELTSNPGAIRSTSTVQTADFYGNAETWVVDTFRLDGREEVLLQRVHAGGGDRLVLPPEVTAAMSRQRDRGVLASRKRAGRQAIATRIARGDNPAASLQRARKAVRK